MSGIVCDRLLIVEDSPSDAEYLRELLDYTDGCRETLCVETLKDAASTLRASKIDCVLLDLRLPDGEGLPCVQAVKHASHDVPIVVLTGLDDDELALACIRAGAQDYLAKQELHRPALRRAIAYAIVRVREARATRHADELRARLAAIVEASNDAIFSFDLAGKITSWNAGAEHIFGYAREETLGKPATAVMRTLELDPKPEGPPLQAKLERLFTGELIHVRRDGSEVALSAATSELHNAAGEVIEMSAICRDITEIKVRDRELHLRNQQLVERDRQLRALLSRLHAVREEERTRISREVHDQLGQLLTGFKMDLRWIVRRLMHGPQSDQTQAILARIADAESLVDSTITAVQRIAVELRPSALDALGLAAAVRDEARRFEQRANILTTIDVDLPQSPLREVTTGMFRILQELLSNVARHASASAVCVQLSQKENKLTLCVQDNGVGIGMGVDKLDSSLGLLGVRERARALGGIAEVARSPVRGTIATVEVPV